MATIHRGWIRATPRQPARPGPKRGEDPLPAPADDDGFGERFAALTVRQRNVVRRRCQGLTNDGVARALGVSRETVKNHLTGIFAALGTNSGDLLCYRLGKADAAWEGAMRQRREAA